ncbi:hypothetical protein ABPG72_011337 [Tetrahymena utriculariae]
MNQITFCFIIFLSAFLLTYAIQLPAEFLIDNCQKDFAYYSVGDVYLGDNNYTSIINNQEILLIASLKTCKSCCGQEVLFNQVKNSLTKSREFQNVKIARIELTQNKNFQQQFKQIKRFPFVIYFDGKGNHHIYQELLDINRINRFLKRIFNPLQKFNTFSKLDEYINTIEYDSDKNSIESVKVIGLFYDEEEMIQEIQYFIEVSKDLLSRSELYFCIITNKKEIRAAKNKYQDKWFEGVSLNSIIIQRSIGIYDIIDLSDIVVDMKNLKAEIISKSLRLVDEFTLENYEYYQIDKKKQILVAVVDSILDVTQSKKVISILESLAKQFVHKLHITWVEGNLNPEKRKMLGIPIKVKLPQIAFFRIDYHTKVIFPSNLEINFQNLFEFINDYLMLPLMEVQKKYMNYEQKIKYQKINSILTSFTQLKEKTFIQKIVQYETSLYILLYYLDLESLVDGKVNEKQMREINQVSIRIQQLHGGSVMQFYYCIKQELEESEQALITNYLAQIKPNTLYFYIQNKPIPFKGQILARNILQFISKNTSKSNSKKVISLPKYPEIAEEKLLDYLISSMQNSSDFY